MVNSDTSFLEDIFEDVCLKYKKDITNLTILFPTIKLAETFSKILSTKLEKFITLPQVLSIDTWISHRSKIVIRSDTDLLLPLYQICEKINSSTESIESFYSWGLILLQDFDIIDRSLVEPQLIFKNLYEQRKLTFTHDYLTETQQAAIKSFWQTFEPRLSTHQQDFLRSWRFLYQIYTQFTTRLLEEGIGYPGIAYRKLCHDLEKGFLINENKIVIVGFNMIHPAEDKIFSWLSKHISTEFYWDTDAYYMEDEKQEAGLYLRENKKKSYLTKSFIKPFSERIQEIPKKITIYESSTEIAQIELVASKIEKLVKNETISDWNQIIIVLTKDNLLPAILHALPPPIKAIHTTIGYPITNTSTYQFVEQLLILQASKRLCNGATEEFPIPEVINLLKYIPIKNFDLSIESHIQKLTSYNVAYISYQDLTELNKIYQIIFRPVLFNKDIISYLLDILILLGNLLEIRDILDFERQSISYFLEKINYIGKLLDYSDKISLEGFKYFFRQIVSSNKILINSIDDDKKGIQILRLSETHGLDFKYIFIVGMNEGFLPAKITPGSLIPYNIRKGHGLPTLDTLQSSLDAYYFYRLLQRSKEVHITYSTLLGVHKQDMSRFLWQLLYESKLVIKKHTINISAHPSTVYPIIIQKTKEVLEKLNTFTSLNKNERRRTLTPSALNTYLDCSLKFYFRYILQIKEQKSSLNYQDRTLRFGILLHEILEKLYNPLAINKEDNIVLVQDIEDLQKQIPAVITQIFSKNFHYENITQWQGEHIIEQEVIQRVIDKILDLDKKYVPFRLIDIEMGRKEPLTAILKLENGTSFTLGGIIDRVDIKDNTIRIVDYKTGNDNNYIENVSSLFDRKNLKRNKSVFQILLYTWIFKQQNNFLNHTVVPIIINTRTIFDPNLDLKIAITDENYQKEFILKLESLLTEIVDLTIPFSQTENYTHCMNCPYKKICQRN